jgi:hypothetical protein
MGGSDIGLEAVEKLFETLQVDEEWAARRPRGFTWWAYGLAQHVDASEPWQDGEFQLSKIRIVTELVRSVDPKRHPERVVAAANMHGTLSSVVLDPATSTLKECCTAIVHRENVGWLSRLLATAAIIQNDAAHRESAELAKAVGGAPATSVHPTNGTRATPDDALGVPKRVIIPAGKGQSAFSGELCAVLGEFIAGAQLLGFSDSDDFTCEVPFTGSTPTALKVALGMPEGKKRPETSLVRIFADQEHPTYGHGARVTLFIPMTFAKGQAARVANRLNMAEATGSTPVNLLGAWCPDPTNPKGNTIAFNAFLPSWLAGPGILENQVVFQAARSRTLGATGFGVLEPGV